MRRWVVALLVCAALAATLAVGVTPAAGVPTIINFDEQPNFAYITSQYSGRGVTFTNTGGATVINNVGMARSDPNYIACGTAPGQEFCGRPIEGVFSPAQARVRVWVGYANGATSPHTTTLYAYNSANGLVGSMSRSYAASNSSSPITAALEVSTTANTITRFVVDDTYYFGNVAADDVEFERVQPDLVITPNPADFGGVNVGSSAELDIALRNSGTATLGVSAVAVSPAVFTIVSDGCTKASVAPGAQCIVRVRFTPSDVGDFTGTIDVRDNTPAGQHSGRLIGRGQRPGTPTTTSTSTTSTTSTPASTSTTRPTSGSTTTTPTTIPTIVTIPPPTPGVTLTVDPPLGHGGFVTKARGSGFPANQFVGLGWSPGIGLFVAQVGPDGTFETQILVMNRDILGPRTLVATSGAVSASAPFLVVPSTVQPSGQDVTQITRIRRFLQR